MYALANRGSQVDIRAYELASASQIAAELQPVTLDLVGDATVLLGELLDDQPTHGTGPEDASGSAFSSHLPFEREIDAAVATRLGSRRAVDEIAFIAQLELRQRHERLSRLRMSQGALALLGECDSSLRRVRKALEAVDVAIARAEAVAPRLDFTSELETSLAVRRAYAKFRRRVTAGGEPAPQHLHARLRAAGTHIAKLIGWTVYPDLRVQDRLLLRDLQTRILAWLREGDAASGAAGLRLWQDLASCTEMFALVNRRQELVAHDGAVVGRVRDLVRTASPLSAALEELASLQGLDPELDALLGDASPTSARVEKVLERLASQLGVAPGTPPGGGLAW